MYLKVKKVKLETHDIYKTHKIINDFTIQKTMFVKVYAPIKHPEIQQMIIDI